jgi:hypothetical protein
LNSFKTRLKRLPVISREHFRKTRTNYFYKHLFGISNTNLQNGISNTSAFKKAIGISTTNWYLECRLVLRVPIGTSSTNAIGTSNTNWYFKDQLVLQRPIGTSKTNWYFKDQLVLQRPIGTSKTNWYFKDQLVLQRPFGTSNTMINVRPRTTRTTKWI